MTKITYNSTTFKDDLYYQFINSRFFPGLFIDYKIMLRTYILFINFNILS